jgi:nascent polypeptide-associated complex subunit alpha
MTKLGMKPVTDIVRVTFKKSKNFMLYIDDPEVLKSPGAENTYIIFGEAKINDLSGALGQKEAQQYANPEKAVSKDTVGEPTEKPEAVTKVEEEETGPLDETGLSAEAIESVISGAKVTRNQAIRALRETDGDSVDAIIKLTK